MNELRLARSRDPDSPETGLRSRSGFYTFRAFSHLKNRWPTIRAYSFGLVLRTQSIHVWPVATRFKSNSNNQLKHQSLAFPHYFRCIDEVQGYTLCCCCCCRPTTACDPKFKSFKKRKFRMQKGGELVGSVSVGSWVCACAECFPPEKWRQNSGDEQLMCVLARQFSSSPHTRNARRRHRPSTQ